MTKASSSLVIFTKAALLLAEADTIQKAKELKDMAIVAGEWAKRKQMGEEAIQHCRSYALEAERKMGEMYDKMEKAKGTRGQLKGDVPKGAKIVGGNRGVPPTTDLPTLASLGLTKKEASRARQLASLPVNEFEKVKAGVKTLTQVRRERTRAKVLETVKLPSGKFRVFYADPPWKYGDRLTEDYGPTVYHYPSMTITELCALPVADLAEPNAVLFLWVTSPLLGECWPVIKAWGFSYKTSFVWDKVKHNMGHYNSVRHEFLLVCTRGSCTPDNPKLFDSVQSIERTKHSEKPEAFRTIVETLYPRGKRLELFGRREAKGWTIYGNQVSAT